MREKTSFREPQGPFLSLRYQVNKHTSRPLSGALMQEALQVLEAYERTFFTGLPEVDQDINLDKSRKAIAMVSDCFKNSGEMRKLAVDFIEVLSILLILPFN